MEYAVTQLLGGTDDSERQVEPREEVALCLEMTGPSVMHWSGQIGLSVIYRPEKIDPFVIHWPEETGLSVIHWPAMPHFSFLGAKD